MIDSPSWNFSFLIKVLSLPSKFFQKENPKNLTIANQKEMLINNFDVFIKIYLVWTIIHEFRLYKSDSWINEYRLVSGEFVYQDLTKQTMQVISRDWVWKTDASFSDLSVVWIHAAARKWHLKVKASEARFISETSPAFLSLSLHTPPDKSQKLKFPFSKADRRKQNHLSPKPTIKCKEINCPHTFL